MARIRETRRDRRKAKMLLRQGIVRLPQAAKVGHHTSERVFIKGSKS